MTGSDRLGKRDAEIIEQLLLGRTQRQAADEVGVSERTLRRRLADPGFQRRLMEAHEEAVKSVRRRVTAATVEALQVLVNIAGNVSQAAERSGAQVRVTAARAVLQGFVRLQPQRVEQDVHLEQVPVIDYTIEGIDPEVLR
jgi:hypothetical protein